MKKKMISKFLVLPVFLALALAIGPVINNVYESSASQATMSNGENVVGVYRLNDNFVPSKDIKIKYNGQEYTPTNIICSFPSGKMLSGKYFTLTEYGEYKFTYEAKVDSSFISATQTLVVKKDQYYFDTNESTFDYDQLDFSYQTSGYNEGFCLEMAEGDTFHVSKPINVYENDVTDLINFKCVQRGTPVVKFMNIRLTDCYNPEIYIDISLKRGTYEYERYIQTGFKGSGMVGLVTDGKGTINIDNVLYRIDSNGTSLPSSYKSISESNMTINCANYFFDNSNPARPRIYAASDRTYQYNLVREFNNPDISSAEFPGFTNGNVYLSLTVSSFDGVQKAPIQIASINGKSGKELLSMDYYKDEVPPIITINSPSLTNTALASTKVNLPTAEVIDDTGLRGTYSCTVWYDYDSFEGRKNISTSTDEIGVNYFVPDRLGVYTVEYKAVDYYGNVGTNLLTLNVSSYGTKAFDFKVNEIPSGVKAGTNVFFNDFTMRSINKLNKISVVVTKPNNEIDIIENVDEPYFLERSGKYLVTYNFADAFYSDYYSYSFTAANADTYSFEADVVPTPYYFIANATYSIDSPYCYIYKENGKTKGDVKTYVSYNGGAYELISDNNNFFVDANKAGQSVKFKVTCALDESVFIESETREIIDINFDPYNNVNIKEYFQGNFDKTAESDSISYKIKDSSGELKFVNKLLLSSFSFQFAFAKNTNISTLKVKLTDYLNPNISHTIKFANSDQVSLDNLDPVIMRSNWNKSGEAFTISFNKSSILINDTSLEFANNFTSNYVLLSLEFEGCSANDTTFKVYNVSNQKFKDLYLDSVIPLFAVQSPNSIAVIGDEITVYVPTYCDVLSPSSNSNCTLTVKENGKVVTAKDGTVLSNIIDPKQEYVFEIREYGTYSVSYKFVDGFGKTVKFDHFIYIYDTIAPTLSLSKKEDTQQASSEVSILPVTVSDNLTPAEDINVYYCAYDSLERFVSSCDKNGTLSIKTSGDYTVYVYASDATGNYAMDSYKLTIK